VLARLLIRDIVLIDSLDIGVDDGLTVLTGETGAGKSILLDAFALALGGRGEGGLVREGQPQGHVTAAFDLPTAHPARVIATEAGLDVDGDLILRRVQLADGRTRAFINDQPVSVQILRAVGRALVEIHGQHDDRALVDPAEHRRLLDAFAGLEGEAIALHRLHRAWREAEAAVEAQRAALEKARRDQDYLAHAAEELSKLAPAAGEEEALAVRRTTLMQSEKVAADLNEALEALSGPHAPTPAIGTALRRLERRREQAPALLQPAVDALDQALTALDAASQAIDRALRDAAFEPRELEQIEERLFALRAAARKYQAPVDRLPEVAAEFVRQLQAIDAGTDALARLEQAQSEAAAAYRRAADRLSARRRAAATELDAAVNAELPPLKLDRARFITEVTADVAAAGPHGIDAVTFVVQTNPGTRPGPMMKVASGGELSRFMLALKVVLADRGSAPTLVFDEIDAGVGGAVADAIGQRLSRLAARVQVLSVTHAPQVAARAVRHFLIAKEDVSDGDRVATRVAALETKGRREEIARMLSGATVTDEARAAADRLLKAG
jgi:DNA repair protein RecN (Recombination protein N)